MLLTEDKSQCEIQQKIIVSKDSHTPREHRASNPKRYFVRQYKLDGDLVKNEKCCDFLLINDSLKDAFFIELKGCNMDEAIPQLQKGLQKCQAELCGYTFYFRIVVSRVCTHNLQKNAFRKFKAMYGNKFKYTTAKMEETL